MRGAATKAGMTAHQNDILSKPDAIPIASVAKLKMQPNIICPFLLRNKGSAGIRALEATLLECSFQAPQVASSARGGAGNARLDPGPAVDISKQARGVR